MLAVHHTGFILAEAGQIYRGYRNSDHGIDGEIEFKDDQGRASGKRLYVQLKSGDSYLKKRQRDGAEVFFTVVAGLFGYSVEHSPYYRFVGPVFRLAGEAVEQQGPSELLMADLREIREGKIPLDYSTRATMVPDPFGVLGPGEVCVGGGEQAS